MNGELQTSGLDGSNPTTPNSTEEQQAQEPLSSGSDRVQQIAKLLEEGDKADADLPKPTGHVEEGAGEGEGDQTDARAGDAGEGREPDRSAGEEQGLQAQDDEGDIDQRSDEPGADGEGGQDDGDDAGKLTIKELADKLETSPTKLYDALTVNLGKGQTATLSELKAIATEHTSREVWEGEQAVSLDKVMQERRKAHRAWTEVHDLAEYMQNVPADVLTEVRERRAQRVRSEGQRLGEVIPELQDQFKMDQFRTDAIALLAEDYGFHQDEVIIEDHRVGRILWDYMQMQKTLNEARKFRETKNPPKRKRVSVEPKQRRRPVNNTSSDEKARQVAGILGAR